MQAQKIRIKTGIEVLKEQNFRCLEGKRVGLITNPTGVDNRMRSTIDILHEAPNVNLVALYGPEHGVRGDVHAGDHVTDIKDATTGLPVYSLNVPGVIFRPLYLKPFYSVGKGELLQGVQVHIMDFGKAPLSDLQFLVMQEVAALYPDRAVFDHADKGRFNMFDKVSGSRQIRERFSKRNRWEDIRDYWYKDAEDFRKLSKKYYLYK